MAIGRLPSPAPAVTRSWPSPVGTDSHPALTGSDVLAVAERDMRGTEQKQFAFKLGTGGQGQSAASTLKAIALTGFWGKNKAPIDTPPV